jgi:hypothetical protein
MNFLNPLFERTVSTCEKDNQISGLGLKPLSEAYNSTLMAIE